MHAFFRELYRRNKSTASFKEMNWVIIVMPGGDTYDMYSETPMSRPSLKSRLLRGGLKTFLAAAQVWFWMRAPSTT
jgi:hypothetical protein